MPFHKFNIVRDEPDADKRFFAPTFGALAAAPPPKVDLHAALPPAFDQGKEGSCGPNSAAAIMCFLKPALAKDSFSRQQIYYCVRKSENSVSEDAGVQTRDLFKVLQKTGAAPEPLWPYVEANLYAVPPAHVLSEASKNKITTYQRLVGEADYVSCLASGFPFVLGFTCYDSIESEELARTGVMATPDPQREQEIGGHDVTVVGYDLNFRASDVFKRSDVDATRVSNHALLIRNSWGTDWGINGHFWMPMPYATNPSTGGDAWTGRL